MTQIFFREEGVGRPIILIHGYCETSEIWTGFSSRLANSTKVYSIDLPGFGRSPLPKTPFSIDDIARLVLDWISANGIQNPILVGHSLGGYVALAMCEQAPQEIGGLILFHSTAYPDSEERKNNRNKVIDFVNHHGIDPFIDTYVPGLYHDKHHSSIPFVDKIARGTSLLTLVNYAQAMRDRPSRVEFLKSFIKPMLVIGGQWDPIISPATAEELGALGQHSASVILPEAAHMGMFEQPEVAVNGILDLVSRP